MQPQRSQLQDLHSKLATYQQLEQQWTTQRQTYIQNIHILEQQLKKQKMINHRLINKKYAHKKTCSDQQMLIFNQTHIQSYYHQPIVINKAIQHSHNWNTRLNLRSHLDGVRTLCWLDNFLLSGGSDCLLKIWERDRLKITVRQHLAPIYSICQGNDLVFTGGAEGVIRMWNVTNFMKDQRPVAEGQLHEDSIWQLVYSHTNQLLVSSSSDSSIKIIKISEQSLKQIDKFTIHAQSPTSLCFLAPNLLISGITDSKQLLLFDLEKNSTATFPFASTDSYCQPNKIIFNHTTNQIICGHQDKCLRFYDKNAYRNKNQNGNSAHKTIVAHSDAVTGTCIKGSNGYEIVTCSHDGTVRLWDLRQYRCMADISVHMKKYDEGAMCVEYANNGWEGGCVAVGGADGQIKLLSTDS